MRTVRRVIVTLSLAASIVGIAPSLVAAQRVRPAALARDNRATPRPRTFTLADTTKHASVWWYVGGGAVVGAGVAAIGFALDNSREESFFPGLVIGVVVPASAVLGAGLGWLIHRVVY